MMNNATRITVPPAAWDCHVHVVGAQQSYPMVQDRQYTAGMATVDALRAHLARHQLAHAVIVQPSFYGTDNRCLIDALVQMKGTCRGIAVLADDVSLSEMLELHAAGVRGIRLNLESATVRDPGAMEAAILPWAEKIAPLGWHIQTYAAPDVIAAVAPRIDALPVRFVLDHFAMIPAHVPGDEAQVGAVLELLQGGNTYVKISAPYRISDPSAYAAEAVASRAALFYAANPDRVLWGTDWPHTNREPGVPRLQVSRYRTIPDWMHTGSLAQWASDPAALERILVSNPLALYR